MIVLFTPHVASSNLGDEIIYRYVKKYLTELHPEEQIIELPTHLFYISRSANTHLQNANKIYVGGSNLFSFRFPRIYQFGGILSLLISRRKATLLGVGQHSYEKRRWPLNKWLWKQVLDPNSIHHTRDNQCFNSIKSLGLNALNSGCITLKYINSFCDNQLQSRLTAVFTLTFYRKNKKRDTDLLDFLMKNFKNINFWPQDYRDVKYLKSLNHEIKYKIISPSVDSFTHSFDTGVIYIGTRLHAGIHVLNLKVPSFIYMIDNRAIEMSKDKRIIGFNNTMELREYLKKPYTYPRK